jgi:hypothetical protein
MGGSIRRRLKARRVGVRRLKVRRAEVRRLEARRVEVRRHLEARLLAYAAGRVVHPGKPSHLSLLAAERLRSITPIF